jgi:homoserine acetyltransferase
MVDYEIFELGDVVLQKGATLRGAKLAYKTFGRLNADKSNVIVLLTYMASTHYDNQWVIREGGALDPSKYFIIIPNIFGNSLSSSPSNTPPPYNKARFPLVTYYDNIKCQHRLLTEKFGISKIKLVTGWSMAAAQTFHWGALYPDMVENICPTAGSARTAPHNQGRLVRRAAGQGPARDGPRLCRLGLQPGFLPPEGIPQSRLFLAGGFHHRLLGAVVQPARRQQHGGDDPHLAGR